MKKFLFSIFESIKKKLDKINQPSSTLTNNYDDSSNDNSNNNGSSSNDIISSNGDKGKKFQGPNIFEKFEIESKLAKNKRDNWEASYKRKSENEANNKGKNKNNNNSNNNNYDSYFKDNVSNRDSANSANKVLNDYSSITKEINRTEIKIKEVADLLSTHKDELDALTEEIRGCKDPKVLKNYELAKGYYRIMVSQYEHLKNSYQLMLLTKKDIEKKINEMNEKYGINSNSSNNNNKELNY